MGNQMSWDRNVLAAMRRSNFEGFDMAMEQLMI
jgi:hypothetical protein